MIKDKDIVSYKNPSNLWEKINYLAPIDYIISSYIREYDINKANINILYYHAKLITTAQYEYLYNLPKDQRQIQVGLLLKNNPGWADILKDGITEYRKHFFIANDIRDNEVLSIKNDAIFLVNTTPTFLRPYNTPITFIEKNTYTSFYKIGRKEFYFYLDSINGKEMLDIKGIKKESLEYHKDYMIDFLLAVFEAAQSYPIEEVLSIIKNFYLDYIGLRLNIGYYRRLDSESAFDLVAISKYRTFRTIIPPDKQNIDISYNLKLIVELYKIFSSIYFQRKNGR